MPFPKYMDLMKLTEIAVRMPTIEDFIRSVTQQFNMVHLSPIWNTLLAAAWAEGEQEKPMEDRNKPRSRFQGDINDFRVIGPASKGIA